MGTDKNVKLPDDVLELLREQAKNEGVSVDQAATEAIRIGLEEGRWRRLLARGRRLGRESGYNEEDVESIIESFRNETRGK
jgi:flagellar biosynthesis/type III secretory pathway protein FliH